jgi:ribosomal protein S18 acetylase RimI-like enzyme
MEIRRLGPGDEDVVVRLAEDEEPQTALLHDKNTVFLVAFDHGGEPMGFVFGYELPRRRGDASILFVYEVDVYAAHRRQGVASGLLRELARIARARGIPTGFVLTSGANAAAMRLYESVGGTRPADDDVMWDFEWSAVR